MKLALLIGNRFNPWHLKVYTRLPADCAVTAFRAESEVQRYFHDRDDGSIAFPAERIYFDTQTGPIARRLANTAAERYLSRQPRIVPFADRLEGFDVIQTWELFTDWTEQALEAKKRFGARVAVMVWDNLPFNNEESARRRAIKRRAIEEADAFIVHTERSRRILGMEGVPPERVTFMNPGVDTELFSPGKGERALLGAAGDTFVILFIGWLLPRKGIDFLVQALRELRADPGLRGVNIRLAIIAGGPGRDRVESLARRLDVLDALHFIGSQPYNRMPEFFRAADVFVLPSVAAPTWQEQFGMALIEALACGAPAVATRSGAIPEIAGDAALLCQPNDFLSLYEAIKAYALDPELRLRHSAAGRQRALERFRLEDQTAALSQLYTRLTQP